MYTEFIFGCALKEDTPKILIDSIDYLINAERSSNITRTSSETEIKTFIEEHSLWSMFGGGSAYFPVSYNPGVFRFEENIICENYYEISTRANLKNGGIIEDFLEYVKPYILEGSGPSNVYAYVQYEESDFPTIYSLEYGKTDVLDPEIVKKYDEKQDQAWKHFTKLYNLITPDFQVTDEMLLEKGIDPKDPKAFYSALDITIDHICELYKKAVNGN